MCRNLRMVLCVWATIHLGAAAFAQTGVPLEPSYSGRRLGGAQSPYFAALAAEEQESAIRQLSNPGIQENSATAPVAKATESAMDVNMLMTQFQKMPQTDRRLIAETLFSELSVPSERLLPTLQDPRSLVRSPVTLESNYGPAYPILAMGSWPVYLRTAFDVKLDLGYESGGGLLPTNVFLDGTPDAHKRGRFDIAESAATLGFDLSTGTDSETITQVAIESQFVEGDARLRTAIGRIHTPYAIDIVGGNNNSLLTDIRAVPPGVSANSIAAGSALSPPRPQLKVALQRNEATYSLGIEDAIADDFILPSSDDVLLDRVPTVLGNVQWEDSNSPYDFNAIQLAGILRTFGFEDTSSREHFTTGIGGSAIARFITDKDTLSNFRAGIVGGRGVGTYINGLSIAAAPEDGFLRPLNNLGGFVAYQHLFSEHVWLNVVYGYALSERFAGMPDDTQRKSQTGWVSLVGRWTDTHALALEYQFLSRETVAGLEGENHRVVFAIQWTPKNQAAAAAQPPAFMEAMRGGPSVVAPVRDGEFRPRFKVL